MQSPSGFGSKCDMARQRADVWRRPIADSSQPTPSVPEAPTRGICAVEGINEGPNMTTHDVAGGGYRYLEGVFQYSGGVRALDGYGIERVRFRQSPPIAEGFARIEKYLADQGLPLTSFCACELRS